jgi:hypothetical protein
MFKPSWKEHLILWLVIIWVSQEILLNFNAMWQIWVYNILHLGGE